MATTKKVQLGPTAYSFHDQSTGITIGRGEVKELTLRQFNTPRVKRAINNGHLQLVIEAVEAAKYSPEAIEKLLKKIKAQHAKGMESSKVAKAYSLEEAQLMVKELGYDVDPGDTIQTLIDTIFEEFDKEA